MREVQASCSLDLDLGQAGRAREGGGGSLCFFLFPLPIVPVVSLLNGMGAAATENIYLGLKSIAHSALARIQNRRSKQGTPHSTLWLLNEAATETPSLGG